MTIKFEVVDKDDIPKSKYGRVSKGNSPYDKLVQDFIDSEFESIAVNTDIDGNPLDKQSSNRMYSSINGAIRRKKVGHNVKAKKRKNTIYLVWVDTEPTE